MNPAVKRRSDLNFIRLFAFSLIIVYHFMAESNLKYVFSFADHGIQYANRNMHIASLGVGLFFLISGAGLYLSTDEHTSMFAFYQKRFVRILLPFYIAYLGSLLIMIVMRKPLPFSEHTPLPTILFTLFGMDEFLSFLGIPDFTLGIGEWFLGALLLIYLVFPLINRLFRRYRQRFFGIMTIYYLLIVFFYPFTIPMINNVLVKVYEFILGMYIMSLWLECDMDHRRERVLIGSLCILIILLYLFLPYAIPLPEDLNVTILSLSTALLIMCFEPLFSKCRRLSKAVNIICSCTFEIYLVHHLIIYQFALWFEDRELTPIGITGLFLLELLIMTISAVIIKHIAAILTKTLDRKCLH